MVKACALLMRPQIANNTTGSTIPYPNHPHDTSSDQPSSTDVLRSLLNQMSSPSRPSQPHALQPSELDSQLGEFVGHPLAKQQVPSATAGTDTWQEVLPGVFTMLLPSSATDKRGQDTPQTTGSRPQSALPSVAATSTLVLPGSALVARSALHSMAARGSTAAEQEQRSGPSPTVSGSGALESTHPKAMVNMLVEEMAGDMHKVWEVHATLEACKPA